MYKWLDERLDLTSLYQKVLRKAFPVHHSFFLGEITLFAFVVLVLTGVFLTLNYEPSIREVRLPDGRTVPAAYASILYIDSLSFGAVIRSLHHWSAHAMIAAAFLHMLRILLTGAYKKPRELNYLVGLALLGLAVVTAFTGYALPYDNYAVTATRIGYGIAASIPWVGGTIAEVMFGGEFPGSERSIPRLYSLHVLWLPLLLMALIGLHLAIMIKQKHTQPRYAERVAPGKILGVPMYPQQMVMMGILFALYVGIMTMIAGAFLAHPVEAFGPPNPQHPGGEARLVLPLALRASPDHPRKLAVPALRGHHRPRVHRRGPDSRDSGHRGPPPPLRGHPQGQDALPGTPLGAPRAHQRHPGPPRLLPHEHPSGLQD